jgi:hypothetical protein
VPAAAGRSLRDAARRVVAAGLAPRFGAIPALRPGPACADLLTAAAQVPAPGAGARRGSVVVLRVGRAARRCPPAGPTAIFGRVDVRVPDLRGLALDAALARVVESGLRVALTPAAAGRGRLVVGAQSPAAATNAHAGSVVTLSLAR